MHVVTDADEEAFKFDSVASGFVVDADSWEVDDDDEEAFEFDSVVLGFVVDADSWEVDDVERVEYLPSGSSFINKWSSSES